MPWNHPFESIDFHLFMFASLSFLSRELEVAQQETPGRSELEYYLGLAFSNLKHCEAYPSTIA